MEMVVEALAYFFSFCTLLWITHADPFNLVQNGDFNVEGFVFNQFPVMDVIATGINTLVPFWVATEGGVQMLDSSVYKVPADVNSTTVMHLNYKDGPGRMVSMPMYTLRNGALYTVSCRLADNPDGGPIFKSMRLSITDIFGKRLGPQLVPFVVSNHSTTRSNILWETVALNLRGTGKPAFLTVDSNTPGSYGPLVANIQVSISNIVENGSFENMDSSVNTKNATFFVVLRAPSSALIKWLLEAGSLKIASAGRYQASTDNTAVMLDLNAEASAAIISTTIAIKSKSPHVLLFDSAVNPEDQTPIRGQLLVLVSGQPSAKTLLNEAVDMDSTGFSIDSIGWNTYEFSFETGKEDIKVKITFQSKFSGNNGPLLDNICVYEVIKNLKDANETISDVPATAASASFNFYTNLQGESKTKKVILPYKLPKAVVCMLGRPLQGRCYVGGCERMHCFQIRRRSSSSKLSKSYGLETKMPCARIEVERKLHSFRRALCSNVHTTKQLLLNEQAEQARALHSIRLLQESILCPEESGEDYTTTRQYRRPVSPDEYSLAIDYTAVKTVNAVINTCKLFQSVSSLFKKESHELLLTLVGLHDALQAIVCCPCLNKFQEALEDILLYTTKAYAYLEKLCFTALPSSSHGAHKAAAKMNEFTCRFYNLTVRLSDDVEQSWDDKLSCNEPPRPQRLSFGVTTYMVPIHDVAERLLKKNRAHILLTDLEGMSEYNVELSCPRSSQWFSKSMAMSAKIESQDRRFSQTLHADRVKMEKGSWVWEEAQDTMSLTYDDLVVANVASVTGSLLLYNKQVTSSSKVFNEQKYRTSIQIVGSSRIDLDLQNLFIKGVKDIDHVYYKCFVNSTGREEVLGIYRVQQKQFHKVDQGLLHIVGRGNQPGLRHVLVSIFSSLGFTAGV